MPSLGALLISSIDDELPLMKFFPLNYTDGKALTELLIISENFKKCGKGSLQYKNKIFYYRTYIPTLPQTSGNSLSNESFSDYFIYSYDTHKKKFFLIFVCDLNYKIKNIDNLTSQIFDVLDNDAFEGHKIKNTSCNEINSLFLQYQKLEPNITKYNPLDEINIINKSDDSLNDSSSEGNKSKIAKRAKKRIDSRMVLPVKKKNNSDLASVDFDDLTTVKENETDLSIMFKNNIEKELYLPQYKKWKKIKIANIVLCFILFVIILILLLVKGSNIFIFK